MNPNIRPAPKGHPKWGGRKPGTVCAAKQIGRETIINIALSLKKGIKDDFKRLAPKDRVRFFIELMKFIVPQRQETVIESRSYNEELRRLCEDFERGADAEDQTPHEITVVQADGTWGQTP